MPIIPFRMLHLTSYLLVTAQLLFYLFILSHALNLVSIENFLEQRKIIDTMFANRIRLSYYCCLALSVIMVVMTAKNLSSTIFVSCAIALICLIADIIIAQKGNVPLNTLVNAHATTNGNTDWETVRIQWLSFIKYRAIFTTTGMLSLLAGLVLNEKS